MVGRDLHHTDAHAVGVADPHLQQTPRLTPGLAQYRHVVRGELAVSGGKIGDDVGLGGGSETAAKPHRVVAVQDEAANVPFRSTIRSTGVLPPL